jgi:protein-tyrosine-phosphatase
MASTRRQFKLAIWGLALGYFVFYAPYTAVIKLSTTGLWPGVSGPVSGFRLLPAVVISTAVVLPAIVSFAGGWKYSSRRQLCGLSIPCPRPLVFLSGVGTAIIIGTTTLAFTYPGVSIIFALVLMRGGVLMIGPIVDRAFKRRVRWFSWAASVVTVPAILISLADVNNYQLSTVTATIIIAYLSGYLLRIPCATKLAKSVNKPTTYGYFVEEHMVAIVLLVAIPAVFALIGRGEIMSELRDGFTGFFNSSITLPALIIGALYAGLYCFGTLIYLDCRENTYCIPLNRGSSLLAGFVASYVLAFLFGHQPPSSAQIGSAGLLVMALLLLSPFHHWLEHALDRFRLVFEPASRTLIKIGSVWEGPQINLLGAQPVPAGKASITQRGITGSEQLVKPRRIFLFVCSGNTCRSPMAAAISNAEIAARMKIPFEDLQTVNAQALSAGVSARVGAPLTPEAQEVLSSMNVPFGPHAAQNLTDELANQAEMIFCMTSAHRKAVIEMIPSVAWKTYCLDHDRDIEDPIGKGLEAYVNCARRIQQLVKLRFDECGLQAIRI